MLMLFALCGLSSCKSTFFTSTIGNAVQTTVVLSQPNFNMLGTFKGSASAKKSQVFIKGDSGLIAQAKENLIASMISKGFSMTGSRTLVNVTVDQIENENLVVVTMSADLIEFK